MFMIEELQIPAPDVPELRDHYWKTYGTTLEGLRRHHQVHPEKYLDYVHNIALENFIEPDYDLKQSLTTLPQELWVFTNSDFHHANRVLDRLGIQDCFKGVIDLYALDFIVKPNPDAYHKAFEIADVSNPADCLMFDDLIPNLSTAKQLGLTTVLVGENGQNQDVDYYLSTIQELQKTLPELWEESSN
jgi:putative hydrolase of the HAD superfamily